jgi:hypothetical protein
VHVRNGLVGFLVVGLVVLGAAVAVVELVGVLAHARTDTRETASTIRFANRGA